MQRETWVETASVYPSLTGPSAIEVGLMQLSPDGVVEGEAVGDGFTEGVLDGEATSDEEAVGI
jgi:hypothetical protein